MLYLEKFLGILDMLLEINTQPRKMESDKYTMNLSPKTPFAESNLNQD